MEEEGPAEISPSVLPGQEASPILGSFLSQVTLQNTYPPPVGGE